MNFGSISITAVLEGGLSNGSNLGEAAAGADFLVSCIFPHFCLVFFVKIIAL